MPFTNTDTGEVVDEAKDAVCPLVEYLGLKDGDPKYRFSGSAFYVSSRGIALTAMHCLAMPSDGMWAQQDGSFNMYLTRVHPEGENCCKIELVRVAQASGIQGLDIAILMAGTPNGVQKTLAISAILPKIGDKIFCYSCPNTEGQIDNISGRLHIEHADFEGEIVQHFPGGRGKIFPGQCYEAHMSAPGGTSDGPVFNSQGHVIGVISSGMAGTPPISYFAPVAPILDVEFEFEFLTAEGMRKHSLRSLAKLGLITIFDPA